MLFLLSTAFLSILIIVLLVLYLHKFAKERPKNFPPGPPRLPIWGSYWFLLKENYKFLHLSFKSLGKRYNTDILGLYLGEVPTVVTLSLDLTKEMLQREEFIARPVTIVSKTRSQGEPKGIFFANDLIWKVHRRFSLRHLRDYGFGRRSDFIENFVVDEMKCVMNFLQTEPKDKDKDICKKKGQVLIPDFLYGCLINSVMSMLASTRFEHHEVRKYARAALSFMKSGDTTGGALCITPWLRFFAPDFFGYTSAHKDNKFLTDFMRGIVEEHLETFSDDHHRDFIDSYISENLKQGTELDYTQLTLTVLDYMFPSPVGLGHTLSFFFALLINNPQVQKNIQEEIDRVVGRSKFPHLDDRKNMPYFEATQREVLRIIPVTPLGLGRFSVQDTTLGGYFIPKDTFMVPNLWTAHRDEKVFLNPDQFQPERFLDSDGNLMKKDLTVPFGAGKRLCAGETYARNTMFLIMSIFLQNFSFKSPNDQPIDLTHFVPGVTLSLQETWMVAVPR